ncbi:hypothetical protein [Aquipuribacter nitratireducens]|uniref:Uncharacterized protein n=1 Tax=Aquipuribacter nitratireducens TaxID=650104 RepID=A0ABW0GRL9_9MICO
MPGVVFATQELAESYSRFVDDAAATGRVQELVGIQTSETITSVSASPIPESSVMIVEVSGSDAEDAQRTAQALSEALVDQVSGVSTQDEAEGALARYEELSTEASQLQAEIASLEADLAQLGTSGAGGARGPEADVLRAEVAAAQSRLSVLTLRQEAAGDRYLELTTTDQVSLTLVRDAEVVADGRSLLLLLGGVVGAAAGLAVALALAARRQAAGPRLVRHQVAPGGPARSPQRPTEDTSGSRVEGGDAAAVVSVDDGVSPSEDDPFDALRGERPGEVSGRR